jgi:hypothetical protein
VAEALLLLLVARAAARPLRITPLCPNAALLLLVAVVVDTPG